MFYFMNFINCLEFHRNYKETKNAYLKKKYLKIIENNYPISDLLSFSSTHLRTYRCIYETKEKGYCHHFVFPLIVTFQLESLHLNQFKITEL